jgi:hypothetical protein
MPAEEAATYQPYQPPRYEQPLKPPASMQQGKQFQGQRGHGTFTAAAPLYQVHPCI